MSPPPSDDDDDLRSPKRRATDLRRIVAVAMAVAALLVFAGGTWYAYKRMTRTDTGVPPLIKAETAPTKTAPDDPGGINVPNRDKQVFDRVPGGPPPKPAGSEQLLPAPERAAALPPPPPPASPPPAAVGVQSLPPPRPGAAPAPAEAPKPAQSTAAATPPAIKLPPVATPSAAPAAPKTAPTAAAGQTRIQLVAMRDAESAVAAWQKLKQQHAKTLGGLSPIFERADLGAKGVYHRVQAGPFADRAAAAATCAALEAAKQDCVVVIR